VAWHRLDMAVRARSILVGYDGSEAADRALDAAVDLAGYGSTLAVATVDSGARGGARAPLERARERLLRRQVLAQYLEPVGDPADSLIETARALHADLVVVGRRKRAVKRLVLGSVSAKVVRRAPCDVLVVR
jgi:nucleotide-binding universal stress UspA family protein